MARGRWFLLFTVFLLLNGGVSLWSTRIQVQAQKASMSHDFDFLFGSWSVEHRRLKHRLTHSNDWETFGGTCVVYPLLGGRANVDDNLLHLPSGEYRAASLRAFDSQKGEWSIWWLDGRTPNTIGPAVVGTFRNGVGTFYADDIYDSKPIAVRFTWSDITGSSAKWQQAFSDDSGRTWETNWVMTFTRLRP